MILLDEIEVGFEQKPRKEKEKFPRESLPPYSPRLLLYSPDNRFLALNNHTPERQRLSTLRLCSPPVLPPAPRSHSSLTLNSYVSSQTLVGIIPSPPLSAPPPSSPNPQFRFPSSVSCFDPFSRSRRPPAYLRAANNVYIQRDSASITESFLIDPSLYIPDCLLPDDSDLILCNGKQKSREGRNKRSRGKVKSERANLYLVTRSGDVCVDVWIREGCASCSSSRITTSSKQGSESGSLDHRMGNQSTVSSESEETGTTDDYWASDWTSPPPNLPWPLKTQSPVNIYVRTESGSVTIRIHTRSHQRLNLHINSIYGSISVGIPRYFVGYVFANSSSSSLSSRSSSYDSAPQPQSLSMNSYYSQRGGSTLNLNSNSPGPPSQITSRQSVQFSEAVMDGLFTADEQRKGAKGQYVIGDEPGKIYVEHIQLKSRLIDEMIVDSHTGPIYVFFNDESLQQKTDKLITKLLNKAR